MKLMKSLILSSAAGLVVVSGAQAADLPLKAKAVEYVKVCSLYGAGFYYIPGTDTCLKLGGYMRADLGVNTNSIFAGNTNGAAGAQNRFSNGFHLAVACRPEHRYPHRHRIRRGPHLLSIRSSPGPRAVTPGNGAGSTAYDAAPAGTSGNGAVSGGQLGVYYAFIQFAGFTMGKAASQFSTPWGHYPGNIFDGLVGGGGATHGREPVHLYGGVRQRRVGLDRRAGSEPVLPGWHSTTSVRRPLPALPTLATALSDYAGTDVPDIVGQLRVDQAWGLFQASVAAHENNPAYYGATQDQLAVPETSGVGPVSSALSIKNIPTGPGDIDQRLRASTPMARPVTTSRIWPLRRVSTRSIPA